MKRLTVPILLLLAAPALAGADGEPATLFERGSYRRAAAAAEQVLAAAPADASALGVLARVRARESRFEDAIALGERAVKAAPSSATAHFALAEVSGMRAQQGSMLKGLGAARTFKREIDAALALDPKYADALNLLIQFHNAAPGIAGGDKKQVPALTERLVAADPVKGWSVRAQDALEKGDSTRAGECWRKAHDADPASVRARVTYASWLFRTRQDVPGAERLAKQATQDEPWRVGGWQVLAGVMARQRRWADLEATLTASETATDGRREAWYTAAAVLLGEKLEPARAERYLRYFLERSPELESFPPAAVHWRLAVALEQQSRVPEAKAELETALKFDGKFEPAKKDLKRLKG
jgi:tetratricopeptide (TPR) repeat protein